MAIRILNADCLTALPQLAAEGFRAHSISGALKSLQLALHSPVARSAERDQVTEFVCLPVIAEQAIRPDVVNVSTRREASLACVGIPFASRALLRRPVRPAVAVRAVDELRMVLTNTVRVAACASAVLGSLRPRRISRDGAATTNANSLHNEFRSAAYSGVLACRRTMPSSSMVASACIASKASPTKGAVKVYLCRGGNGAGALAADASNVSTVARAVPSRRLAVWSNLEAYSALLTGYCNHWAEA